MKPRLPLLLTLRTGGMLAVALVVASVGASGVARGESAVSRPNFILLMADDMGWGDPGFNGNPVIQTPNLDAMARAGLKFERFYSGAPVCSPTRGSCLTGRHPYRYGIWSANEGHLRKEELTLAEALQTQGYTTGHFGKWHLGTLDPVRTIKGATRNPARNYATPGMNGFDEWFSTESAVRTWDPGRDLRDPTQPNAINPYYHNGKVETDNLEGCDSRVLMDRALPFIRGAAQAKRPFLAVIWFHAPHEPVIAGPEFRRMYAGRDEGEQNFYGAITALDVQVGRLRRELRQLGIAENTMVWFASDNGPEGDDGNTGSHRGTAGPFRGRKRSLWDGGIHVPGLLEWPGRILPGTTRVVCSTLDYFPTILDVLGFRIKGAPEPIDGMSLVPLFNGKLKERPVPLPFETLGGTGTRVSRGSPKMAMVDNRYKLLTDLDGVAGHEFLFDLLADPGEATDVAAQHPDVVATLRGRLVEFRESCKRSLAGKDYAVPFTPDQDDIHPGDPHFSRALRRGEGAEPGPAAAEKRGERPAKKRGSGAPSAGAAKVIVQNDDSGVISLGADAAALHGGLTYRADQAKIGQWFSVEDWVSWEFELRRGGKFEVELNCGHPDGGSGYVISVGDQTLNGVVAASADFRTPKPQIAGTVTLAAPGRYTLAVKPKSKQGAAVMTLWRVDLIPAAK